MISIQFGQGSSSDDDDDDDDDDDEGYCLFALEYSSSSLLSFGRMQIRSRSDRFFGVFSIEVSKANFSRSNKIPWIIQGFVGSKIWMFPKIGGNPPKWMMVKIMENPIKMDDLGVPLFLETPISINLKGDIFWVGYRKNTPLEKETYLQTTNSLDPC